MTISKSDLLMYYKREDIRQAMCDGAVNKEVAVRYGDGGYGKRPDILSTAGDVLELVKRGSTSFHASEEIWRNPLQIKTGMPKKEAEELRIGWDLVLDVDCPHWELAKLTTKLMIRALNENGIKKSVSVKFSGNKGFHIGVPFEAFPSKFSIKGEEFETHKLFPDAARKVALFVVDYISKELITVQDDKVHFGEDVYSIQSLASITGKTIHELTLHLCSNCSRIIKKKEIQKPEFICPKCESREVTESDEEYLKCKKCSSFMNKLSVKQNLCQCGSNESIYRFDPLSIVEVDTILISSRHLYRMEFSMHEKSGMVSVPFNPEKIDKFEKEYAEPKKVKVSKFRFLDREACVEGEGLYIFQKAYENTEKNYFEDKDEISKFEKKEFEIPTEAVPEDLFPPCIKKGLTGMKDGKKRFLFALSNFLLSSGWAHDQIGARVKEWNNLCLEPLRDQYLTGHLRYQKTHKINAPPPNCDNTMYFKDLGLCFRDTDTLCQKIKNPLSYSKRKTWGQKKIKKKKKSVRKIK